MPQLNLKAVVTGVGAINNTYIYLENVPTDDQDGVPILLYPTNSQKKEWDTVEPIQLEVHGDLEYQVNVHALKGTKWTFKLTNVDTEAELINISGKTGSDTSIGLNVSIKKGTKDLTDDNNALI